MAQGNIYGERFDNISAFHYAIDTRETQPAFQHILSSKKTGAKRTRSTGTSSYSEADRLLLNGDPDAKAKIDTSGVAKVLNQVQHIERRRRQVLSPCGFLPHVPNYLAGVPNSMISERTTMYRKPVLDVAYNVAASCHETADTIQQAAAKMMSAILRCERAGVRINLYSMCICKKNGDYVALAIKIKDSAQHIDLLKMAYPMTSPSMLRRHVFRYIETLEGVPSIFSCGYGQPVETTDEMQKCLKHIGINADSILGFSQVNTMTVDEVVDAIMAVNK